MFEWDEKKASRNLEKHGVGFEEVQSCFSDGGITMGHDLSHSGNEDRYVGLGGLEMAKKSSASSAQDKHRKIDFSDIPELTDEEIKKMRPVGRPPLGTGPRKMIAVRLDPEVLKGLKKEAKRSGKPYQSLINEILAKYVKKAA